MHTLGFVKHRITWIRVKAKAKREGVSLRSLILKWCAEWVKE